MFIEKFTFGNYQEIAKMLNENVCEYSYDKDKKCVKILSEPDYNINNKAKTIYEFYDFDVKCFKLKYFEKESEYHYVNVSVKPSLKSKYIKYMKKTFSKEYEKNLNGQER